MSNWIAALTNTLDHPRWRQLNVTFGQLSCLLMRPARLVQCKGSSSSSSYRLSINSVSLSFTFFSAQLFCTLLNLLLSGVYYFYCCFFHTQFFFQLPIQLKVVVLVVVLVKSCVAEKLLVKGEEKRNISYQVFCYTCQTFLFSFVMLK